MAFNQGIGLLPGNDKPPSVPLIEWTKAPYDSTLYKKVFKGLFLTSKPEEKQDDSALATSENNFSIAFQTVHLESNESTREPAVTIVSPHCQTTTFC